MKTRVVGRPLPKGKTGNPGGRPKRTAQEFALIQACQAKTAEALHTIETLMKKADKDSVRLAAAVFIIERAHGKAVETTHEMSNPLDGVTADLLLEMREHFQGQRSARSITPAIETTKAVKSFDQ